MFKLCLHGNGGENMWEKQKSAFDRDVETGTVNAKIKILHLASVKLLPRQQGSGVLMFGGSELAAVNATQQTNHRLKSLSFCNFGDFALCT